MKTKGFLLFCLFLGIGLAELTAQNGNSNKNINRTYVLKYENSQGFFLVTCDGTSFNPLTGVGDATEEVHCSKGIPVWDKWEVHWTATNSSTGEIFKSRELDKLEIVNFDPTTGLWLETTGTWRAIMSGDMGSRYKITLSVTFTQESFTWSLIDYKCF
jgi:hypothetical protein